MPLAALERTDDHHRVKHAQILALPDRNQIEVVLLGDSLTRRWEDNPDQWHRHFGQFRAANLGVGGDCLENILWRVEHGELEGMAPGVLVLLAGTNNLPRESAAETAAGIADLVTVLRSRLPQTKILVLGLLPRNPDETGRPYPAMVTEVNARIRSLADGRSVFFEDLGELFPARDGRMDPAVMPDGLHLNSAGYDRLGPVLTALIRRLQG